MLTKTLKFDDDVLDILRSSVVFDVCPDKTLAVIEVQLERPMYEKVNKALEAMGGKWSRKEKAHVFPADPRPQVEGLLTSGELVVEKDGFFETPYPVAMHMVQLAAGKVKGDVLEPSAGKGALLDVILEQPGVAACTAVERNPGRAAYLAERYAGKPVEVRESDFLNLDQIDLGIYDCVVMNPPFEAGQEIDHVRHAYGLLKDGGVLLSVMSEGPFFRNDRRAVEFREWLRRHGGHSEPLPEGSFKASGTGVNTRLVVLEK